MPRINVWVPDELHRSVRRRLPGLNVSAVVQAALAAQLDCDHEQLRCASCATPVDHRDLIDDALSRFYAAALWDLGNLARTGGTAEGAARVLKATAQRQPHVITAADRIPLPRLTRRQRAALTAADVTPLPTEAAARRRHPTARSKTA